MSTNVAGPPVHHPRHTRWAWTAAAVSPLLLPVGFVLGYALVGDPNDPAAPHGWAGAWRVLVWWAALELVPALGIVWGVRAVRQREAGGRGALTANVLVFVFFVGATLIAGLVDTFN